MEIGLSGGYRPADFETDGSLRDICVLDADIRHWEKLFRAVVAGPWPYELEHNGRQISAEDLSPATLFGEGAADVSVRLEVHVEPMWFTCFPFEPGEIEFSFSPAELADGRNFGSVERFMIWLATVCRRPAILTMESSTGHSNAVPLLETQVAATVTTFDYKVLHASWGIQIAFTAEARPSSQSGVRVVQDVDGAPLDDEMMSAVVSGIALVAEEISAAVSGHPVDIVVRSVRYAETDFQVEGLTAAAVGWAVERFGLPSRPVAVRFDRERNRYVFGGGAPGH
ncbi:hypothetical protein [Actinoplanes sp. NPDC049316]|uniref:hypothetical protein n=1 Tax=Actinoplanes sp. NPDC049316 TaxID=3154727 RepID=UPI00343EB999